MISHAPNVFFAVKRWYQDAIVDNQEMDIEKITNYLLHTIQFHIADNLDLRPSEAHAIMTKILKEMKKC